MITALTNQDSRRALGIGALWLFFFSIPVQAHSTGHGPPIPGRGPHGGEFVAIVSAKEADLGDKAKALGVAEWWKDGKSLKFYLWNSSRTAPLALQASSEVKWIVLYEEPTKPYVVKTSIDRAEPALSFSPGQDQLRGAKMLEVILPSLGAVAEKHVFAVVPDSAKAPQTK
jgi:hypothetical protein